MGWVHQDVMKFQNADAAGERFFLLYKYVQSLVSFSSRPGMGIEMILAEVEESILAGRKVNAFPKETVLSAACGVAADTLFHK